MDFYLGFSSNDFTQAINDRNEELTNLENDVSEKEALISEKRNKTRETDKKITKLNNKINKIETKQESLLKSKQTVSLFVEEKQTYLSSKEKEITSTKTNFLKKILHKIPPIKKRNQASIRKKIDVLAPSYSNLNKMNRQIGSYDSKINSNADKINQITNNIQELKQQNENLKSELENLEYQKNKICEDINVVKEDIVQLSAMRNQKLDEEQPVYVKVYKTTTSFFSQAFNYFKPSINQPPPPNEPPPSKPNAQTRPAQEPVVDEPVVDEPVVDEPVVDEPVIEAEQNYNSLERILPKIQRSIWNLHSKEHLITEEQAIYKYEIWSNNNVFVNSCIEEFKNENYPNLSPFQTEVFGWLSVNAAALALANSEYENFAFDDNDKSTFKDNFKSRFDKNIMWLMNSPEGKQKVFEIVNPEENHIDELVSFLCHTTQDPGTKQALQDAVDGGSARALEGRLILAKFVSDQSVFMTLGAVLGNLTPQIFRSENNKVTIKFPENQNITELTQIKSLMFTATPNVVFPSEVEVSFDQERRQAVFNPPIPIFGNLVFGKGLLAIRHNGELCKLSQFRISSDEVPNSAAQTAYFTPQTSGIIGRSINTQLVDGEAVMDYDAALSYLHGEEIQAE